MSTSTADAKPKRASAQKTAARKAPAKKRLSATKKGAPRKTVAKSAPKKHDDRYVVAQSTLSLVALSPFRFPLDLERLAVNTARIGGVAFVFLGLLFTYGYIENEVTNIVVENAMTASVASSAATVSALTPEVSFAYVPAGLHGEHITVHVADAEEVMLYAYDGTIGEYQMLGPATQTRPDVWEFIWDTIDVAPGQYWIKALVTNEHGMYDRSDSQYVEID